jgi:hypothetical protein
MEPKFEQDLSTDACDYIGEVSQDIKKNNDAFENVIFAVKNLALKFS